MGVCAATLRPLYLLIEAHVLAAERLHGDDTTVPMLAKGKTDIARIWTYVRDDRPFGGLDPPAALFHYSRDRRAEHPVRRLRSRRRARRIHVYAYRHRSSQRRRSASVASRRARTHQRPAADPARRTASWRWRAAPVALAAWSNHVSSSALRPSANVYGRPPA